MKQRERYRKRKEESSKRDHLQAADDNCINAVLVENVAKRSKQINQIEDDFKGKGSKDAEIFTNDKQLNRDESVLNVIHFMHTVWECLCITKGLLWKICNNFIKRFRKCSFTFAKFFMKHGH